MKNLVLTIAVGDAYQEMAQLTHPTIRRYAEKVGADFLCIDKSTLSTPHWEKLTAIYGLLNRYERILYADTDILIRDDCPDLFEIVQPNQLAAFDEAPFTDGRGYSMSRAAEAYGIKPKQWDGRYFNTGVMLVPRQFKELFTKPEKEDFNFYEQGYLNLALALFLEASGNEYSVHNLDYRFNRMTCMDRITGEERFGSYVIHYAGYPSLDGVIGVIKGDLKRWQADAPSYSYCRHVLLDVQGGLGDQVCAEPVIRFLRERVYPDADVTVKTHWPRLFRHIPVTVCSHDEFRRKPDTPYYHVVSLPGPETLMWSCVSNLLCHTVDYVSMALLRRTLPNADKWIRLPVHPDDMAELLEVVGIQKLDELVLVHPGRHWESKTFPVSWWQEVVDGLANEVPVCLIGRDEKTRGTLNVKVPDGVLDTRNLLSLDALIALIASARCLVSNDSAPIHIAGAFDIEIVLIPTCKHPDHILPFRHGSQSFRAKALFKKLMCDEYESAPTTIYGSLGDKVPGDWADYLPEPSEVVQWTTKTLRLNYVNI